MGGRCSQADAPPVKFPLDYLPQSPLCKPAKSVVSGAPLPGFKYWLCIMRETVG